MTENEMTFDSDSDLRVGDTVAAAATVTRADAVGPMTEPCDICEEQKGGGFVIAEVTLGTRFVFCSQCAAGIRDWPAFDVGPDLVD